MNLEKDFEIYRFKLGKLYGKLSFFPESLSFVNSGNKKDKNGNLRGNILKLQECMKNYNELKEKENEIVNKKNEESKEFEKKKSKLDLKEKTPENANTGTTKKEKKQVDKLEKQIKYSEQQIKKLNDKAEKIKKKISDLLAKMSDYDDNNLNSIIKDIKNSIENKKLNIADESIEKFSEKIPKFDDNQLSENFNKLATLAKEYDELKKDYDELKNKTELEEKDEKESNRKVDEEYKNNLEKIKTEIIKLLNELKIEDNLDIAIEEIKSKLGGLHPKKTLSEIFKDFNEQYKQLKNISNNLNESSDFIKKDLQNIDKLNEKIQTYENNLKKLDNDIRSKKESEQKNKESMEILKNQLKQLDKNTQKEDIQRLEKEINEKNQANQKYEKLIIELEQQRENLGNELDKKQKELNQLNEKRLKLIQNLKDIRNSGRYSEISDGANYLCMNLEFADLKKRKKMITDVDKCMKRISNDLKELKRYRSWFFKKDNVAKTAYKFSFDLYRSIKKDLKQNDNFDDLFSVYDKLLMASSYIRDAIKARILEKKLHNNESDFTRNVLKSLYDNFSNLCIIIFNKHFPEIAYDFESLRVSQDETIAYYKKLIKSDLKKLYNKTSGIFRKYNAAKILYTCLSKFDIDNLGLECKSNIKNDAIVKIKEGIESRRKEIIDRTKSKKKEISDNDFRNDETLTIMYHLLEDFVNVGKSLKIDVDVDLEDLDEGLEIDEQTAKNYQAGIDAKIAELSKTKEKIENEIEQLKGNVKDKIEEIKENLKNQISRFVKISYKHASWSALKTYELDLSKNQTVSSKCQEFIKLVEGLKFDNFLPSEKAHEKFKTWGENFSKDLDKFVINLKKIAEEEFQSKWPNYRYEDYNIDQKISDIQSDIKKIISETSGYLENNSKNILSKINKCKEYSEKINKYKKDSEKIFKKDSKIKLRLRDIKVKIEEFKDSLRDKILKFIKIPYKWLKMNYTLDLSKNSKVSSKCRELISEVGKLKFNDFLKDKQANENFKKWSEEFLTNLEKFIPDLKEIAQNECPNQKIDYKSYKIEEIILKIQQDIQNSISETSKYFGINIEEILPEMNKPEWEEIFKNYSQGNLRLRAIKGAKILGDVVTSFFIPGANVGRVVVTLEGVKLVKKIAGTSGVDKSSIVILVSETDIDCKLFKVASSSPAKLRVYLTLSSPLLLNMLSMVPDGTRIVDCIGNLDIQNNFRSGKIYFHPYGGHSEKYEGEKEDPDMPYNKKKMALKAQKDYGKSKQIMKEIKAKIAELRPSILGKVFKSDITKSVYEPINHIYKNFRKSLKSASADDVESKEFLRAAKSFVSNKMSDFQPKNEQDQEKYNKMNQYLGELFGKLVDLEKYMFGYKSELKSENDMKDFMSSQDRAKIFGEILAASDLLGMGALIFTIENATLKGLMSAGNEHFMPGRNSYVACVADLNIKMTLDSYLAKKEDEGYGKSIAKNILAFFGTSGVTANIIAGGAKILGLGEKAGMIDTFASFLSILDKGIRIRTYVSVDNFTFATKMINITTKLQKGKIKLIK